MTDEHQGGDGLAASAAVADLVATAAKAATAYDRPDLAERLQQRADRLADPEVRILVVGEFKQGKSTLVNALVGYRICPVDDDIATATPTVVRHGEALAVTVTPASAGDDAPEPRPVAVEDLPALATEAGDDRPERIDVWVPSPFLAGGVTLVDTPGVGGIGSPSTAATISALATADAVVFVTDAAQELTAPELEVLQLAVELCPNAVVVLSKRDLYPAWRRMADLDRSHLTAAGLDLEVLAVSPVVYGMGRNGGIDRLVADSGFEALVDHLRRGVIDRARHGAERDALTVARAVVVALEDALATDRAATADPAVAEALRVDLDRARADAGDLRAAAARWQTVLGDGLADLTAEAELDLRGRIRGLGPEVDEVLADTDPAEGWDELEAWLRRRSMAVVAENAVLVHRGLTDLAAAVGDAFGADAAALEEALRPGEPATLVDALSLDPRRGDPGPGRGSRAFTGLRSSYGGILMFGMFTNLAGLAMLNPLTVVAGVAVGRKALRDERRRRLDQARAQAKASVQRYLDELAVQAAADVRRTLRSSQRTLRDHWSGVARDLERSVTDALGRAEAATRADAQERPRRLAALDRELERVGALRGRVESALDAAGAP